RFMAASGPPIPVAEFDVRILILNWRDPEHPQAGGAEGYLHAVARRWAMAGHRVCWLAGAAPGLAAGRRLDGVDIVRRGRSYGVFPAAATHYLSHLRGRVDVIVDSENGIPFFSPLYSRVPKIVLVHHVHQEVFRRELPVGASHLAAWLEASAMPWAYRRDAFVAVSPSTRQDLADLGVPAEQIAIIHNGLDADLFHPPDRSDAAEGQRTRPPTVLWIGRLRRYKCVETVIDAASLWAQSHPTLQLLIAGDGPSRPELEERVRGHRLGDRVSFLGFVDDRRKVKLLQDADLVVQTSMKEGWGMTVIEANACGTPVVASRVAGLKDSVRDGETGQLVPWNDASALADAVTALIDDGDRRQRYAAAGLRWARSFSWARSADRWLDLIHADRPGGIVPAAMRDAAPPPGG
ncbi:MAG: glycosyltransferase family 4 protein, partial [Acidobacteriota bacterium]